MSQARTFADFAKDTSLTTHFALMTDLTVVFFPSARSHARAVQLWGRSASAAM